MHNEGMTDDQTLSRLAHQSGDPWKPSSKYFKRAEAHMRRLWDTLIFPFISRCDFSRTVDLAAGHGRNSALLLPLVEKLTIMDIQSGNVERCKERFSGAANVDFVVNNGFDLQPVSASSVTLVYCFDAMVHIDSDVVRSYLRDTRRVLVPQGCGFFHHSNSPFFGDWQTNPGGRNFMTAELFRHYALKEGLEVVEQKVISWGDQPDLDCLTLVKRPQG